LHFPGSVRTSAPRKESARADSQAAGAGGALQLPSSRPNSKPEGPFWPFGLLRGGDENLRRRGRSLRSRLPSDWRTTDGDGARSLRSRLPGSWSRRNAPAAILRALMAKVHTCGLRMMFQLSLGRARLA
jgi:hypothetical protein